MFNRHRKLTFLFLLTFVIPLNANTAVYPNLRGEIEKKDSANDQKSIFEVLNREGVLDITIKTDLVELIDNRKMKEYQKATLSYLAADGRDVTRDIKVKPRGKFRRRICDFPPVKIKFPKKQLLEEGLKEFNTLKLVTHCLDDKFAGNENVLKEYLVYKLYNQLTDNSYRVQLVKITYLDSKGKLSKIKRYGFLLENTKEMADRLGGEKCDCLNPQPSALAAGNENRMAVFQYLIGNEDWDLTMARNIKLIQPNDGGKLLVVPYDFDFSGLVNTPYAVPNSNYGLSSVLDRYYLGNLADDATLRKTFTFFMQQKSNLIKIVSEFKLLSKPARNEIIAYLNSCCDILDQILQENVSDIYGALKKSS